MKIEGSQPIGKFAGEVPGATAVFEAMGIDYACLCDQSLDDAASPASSRASMFLENWILFPRAAAMTSTHTDGLPEKVTRC